MFYHIKSKYFNFIPITVFFIFLSSLMHAQPGCPSVDAGPDQTLTCTTTSTNLTATVLATGATTSYAVSSIPYSPPYQYNTGTPILVNQDDIWGNAITLPFTFCFFGNNYTQLVAGANGCVSFNTSNANQSCAWQYTATCPNNYIIDGSLGPYILGPYHDIDPGISGTMKYAILGAYPCRTFVVSWNQVPMFACNTLLATHQIVIYESTNVIEVYIQNKPLCTTWNSGNAVIGIQNAAGSSGICPPGRNTGQWTASNEAWRFTPNGTPNYSITWWQGTTQIGTTATITVSPTTTTTYTAQVVYDCCAGNQVTLTDSVNVIVNGSINLTINPTNPTICAGDSSTLTALSNNPAATFQWSTGASGTSINVNPITNTTYTVTATTPGCTDQTSVTVAVTPVPIITVNDTTICGLQTLTLKASGATTYLWSTGNTNSSIIISPTATTTYTVTGTDSGCTGSASGVVTVNPLPVANAGNDQIVCQGRNVTLTASGGTSYQWSNGVAQNIPFTQSVTTATTYTVTVSNSYDCTATDTVIVTGKLCNITVPNVFTPNGDGYNDFFVIKGLEDYPNTIVQIFNRWGKNVYESTNYQNDWDGKSLSDGIYFFVITFIDYHDPMTGTVMIFRKN